MRLVAQLDSNKHVHVFGHLVCPQFNSPKPIHLVIDTGSTTTTLLSDDVTRLAINCSKLPLAPQPCITANGSITPYLLPKVDLMLEINCGWLNRKRGIGTFRFEQVNCLPPANPALTPHHQIERAHSLLGMDVLSLFRKWGYTEKERKLET